MLVYQRVTLRFFSSPGQEPRTASLARADGAVAAVAAVAAASGGSLRSLIYGHGAAFTVLNGRV